MDREQLFAAIVAARPDRSDLVYLQRHGDRYDWRVVPTGDAIVDLPSSDGPDVWMSFSAVWPVDDPARMRAFFDDLLADRRALAALPLAAVVAYRITADERARFKRCRRQWDFGSPHRRNLEPVASGEPSLPTAVVEALAVYYYPGTWDWPHELTQSLVHKALERSLAHAPDVLPMAAAILDCYDAWAGAVDDFAPIRIDHDVSGLLPDPDEPERGLTTADGTAVVCSGRVDLLAVDAADEYWVVRHHVVDDWQHVDRLLRDEEAVAACWAWEQDYMGMDIAGTIHNEIRIGGRLEMPAERPSDSKQVAQHEPSGGGRSIPQHRRVYPAPAEHCGHCEFAAPCLAMMAADDAESLLVNSFRRRRGDSDRKPRLGQATWGFGRGAAPPQW